MKEVNFPSAHRKLAEPFSDRLVQFCGYAFSVDYAGSGVGGGIQRGIKGELRMSFLVGWFSVSIHHHDSCKLPLK